MTLVTLPQIAYGSLMALENHLGPEVDAVLLDYPQMQLRRFEFQIEDSGTLRAGSIDSLVDQLRPLLLEMATRIKINLGGQHPLEPLRFFVRNLPALDPPNSGHVFTASDPSAGWCLQVARTYHRQNDQWWLRCVVECAPVKVQTPSMVTENLLGTAA